MQYTLVQNSIKTWGQILKFCTCVYWMLHLDCHLTSTYMYYADKKKHCLVQALPMQSQCGSNRTNCHSC